MRSRSVEWDEQKSVIDLRNAGRDALMTWEKERIRNDIISSLGAITADANTTVTYAAATAAQRNYHLVNNADRTQFGIAVSNGVSGVYATALATVDNAADKMSATMLTLAKRRARLASPHIRPIRVNNDEEWFVVFMPSLPFRDLMTDTTIIQAMQYAWDRGANNPLFTAGDIFYNGLIIREIPGTAGAAHYRSRRLYHRHRGLLPVRCAGTRHRVGATGEVNDQCP